MPFLQLLRIQNFPSALADPWAGYFLFLAWGGSFDPVAFALLSAASLQIYAAGMALNDFVDYTRDLLLHPARPLPSGRLRQGDALLIAAALLAGGGLCGLLASGASAAVAFLLVVLVLAYNLWAKSHRWAGALVMGLLRAGNLLLGLSPGLESLAPATGAWLYPALLGGHVLLFTLLSTYEEDPAPAGAVRRVFGAQLALLAGVGLSLPMNTGGPWLAATLLVWMLQTGVRHLRRGTTQAIPRLVVAGVRGIIVLDAAFVLAERQTGHGLLVLFLLAPALALGRVFRGS